MLINEAIVSILVVTIQKPEKAKLTMGKVL